MTEQAETPFYIMILDRKDLNTLMSKLAEHDMVKTVVSEQGEIEFDIPKGSSFDIKPFNIMDILVKKIIDLEKKQLTYKEGGQKFIETENKILEHSIGLTTLIDIFNEQTEKRK